MNTERVTTCCGHKKVRSILTAFAEHTDECLLRVARKGESGAFGALCERYTKQLLRSAHRVTRNREDAEDAVQNAMLSAFVHLGDFDGRSSFSTWLTRIVINSALMLLRKRRSAIEAASESAQDLELRGEVYQLEDRAPNPERRYSQNEEERILNKAIKKLRPSLRKIVEIQQLQECSIRQAAEVVGISVAAAKSRLFHAKVALRKSPALKSMYRRRPSFGVRVLSAA